MIIAEYVSLGPKTTMHIGGKARYFVEVNTRQELEEAWVFAKKEALPFIPLGAGSNTIFFDGVVQAVVAHINASSVAVEDSRAIAEAGKPLASLVSECADIGLDCSSLAGIPGTVGGAIFGNAGQGPTGTWIDSFVESVDVFEGGTWNILPKTACRFAYRESAFKKRPAVIWSATLLLPRRDTALIKADIAEAQRKRREAQIASRTAGSCFKAASDGTPAWKFIDAAGLRGMKVGDVQLSEKHANFLVNVNNGTYADAVALVGKIRQAVPVPLGVEMRFFDENGGIYFSA
jgi:UDP-N-acetylmuramate dehydrogenase